jgi:hypothetical protein
MVMALLAAGFAARADFLESSEKFLTGIRTPRSSGTWSILSGQVQHRRSGQSTIDATLRLAILFTPKRMTAQAVIDGSQGYLLTQSFKAGAEPYIKALNDASKKKDNMMAHFGINPGDLTMSFIYWKMIKELPRDTINLSECRVFLLESPDKKEMVKVWINVRYRFPLKCEWYKTPVKKDTKFYRAMEVFSFAEIDKIWLVTGIDLYGPGWRTRIKFSKNRAGLLSKGYPKDLHLDFDKK